MCGVVGFVPKVNNIIKKSNNTSNKNNKDTNFLPNKKEKKQQTFDESAKTSNVFDVSDIIKSSLEKLAYRGYDSAGIAVLSQTNSKQSDISIQKTAGKLSKLIPLLEYLPKDISCAIGHTRWATHGTATKINAHPHLSKKIAVVHNGVIENYLQLKKNLTSKNTLVSSTDTEIALKTLNQLMDEKNYSIEQALQELMHILEGNFTMAFIANSRPGEIFVIRHGSPLIVGFAKHGNYICSDLQALDDKTKNVLFLENKDLGILTKSGYKPLSGPHRNIMDEYIKNNNNNNKHPTISITTNSKDKTSYEFTKTLNSFCEFKSEKSDYSKGSYNHFMHKEIHDQSKVLAELIHSFCNFKLKTLNISKLGFFSLDIQRITHIHICGCGSAYYASRVAKYMMESIGSIPCNVELGSEYRYRMPLITAHTLVIAVSQSGETADTLACVHYAKKYSAQILAICNKKHSSLARLADFMIDLNIGLEISVASTKAFSAQVLVMYLYAHAWRLYKKNLANQGMDYLCQLNNQSKESDRLLPMHDQNLSDIKQLISNIQNTLDLENQIITSCYSLIKQKNCLFIGRNTDAWIAYEGALKLKEITYIHAQAYPAGELKHGALALIDGHMCLIALAPENDHYKKTLTNIEEVKARGGRVFTITTGQNQKINSLSEQILIIPKIDDCYLQSILIGITLQLMAYHTARLLKKDIDQPRNLAKSVTVE